MARGYPRFIFSDPKNVKTPGPFIIHTLYPKFIGRVLFNKNPGKIIQVEFIEQWDGETPFEYDRIKVVAVNWIKSQIAIKEILLHEYL